jgi:hypothetical protein
VSSSASRRLTGRSPFGHASILRKDRPRDAALGVDANPALACARYVRHQRQFDRAQLVAPRPADQHQVALVYRTVAQLRVQGDERRPLLGDEQHPRRVTVEPMDEL